jgi:hypothetical protein
MQKSLRFFLITTTLILAGLLGLLLLVIANIAYFSSVLNQINYDIVTDGFESIKFMYWLGVTTIVIGLPFIVFIILLFLKLAFNKGPSAIIEDKGIRFLTNGILPEGFLTWQNIKSYERLRLEKFGGGIFIYPKNPSAVWKEKPFLEVFDTWFFRILSLGLWRGEYAQKKLGFSNFQEFSNDEIEELLKEVTLVKFTQKQQTIKWHDKDNYKIREIFLLSFCLPLLTLALGFASHHFSYLWDDEVNNTRIIRHFAHQGNPDAQTKLGWRYSNGIGVHFPDHQEAVYWYQRAAEQGYAKSQYNLGNEYRSGRGIKRDYDKAAYWYKLAVEQNQPNAKNALATLYL